MSRLLVISMLAVMLVPAHTAGQTTEPARPFRGMWRVPC